MSTRRELAIVLSVTEYAYAVTDVDEYRPLADAALAHLAAEGMVVLGPDGEPLKVTPALADYWKYTRALGAISDAENRAWLIEKRHITGPLADACLAAAEVDG